MKYLLLFFSIVCWLTATAQDTRRDSLHAARGVAGTLDFRDEYRLYFPEYDARGRPLTEIRTENDGSGNFRPVSRRQFTYDGPNRTGIRIQERTNGQWEDRELERFVYVDALLTERTRQRGPAGNLSNDRQWRYAHNALGLDTLVVLQEWSADAWENLTRLRNTYAPSGEPTSQTLQRWRDGAWQNVRRRLWNYTAGTEGRLERTLVQVWSTGEMTGSTNVGRRSPLPTERGTVPSTRIGTPPPKTGKTLPASASGRTRMENPPAR
ncbi:MAG: hypothetical protein AAFZ52_06305 [Bacteroidota bacterium]